MLSLTAMNIDEDQYIHVMIFYGSGTSSILMRLDY